MSRPAEAADHTAESPYRLALQDMQRSGVPFLVGGAFALESYTGVIRRTKDLDVFVLRENVGQLLGFLAGAGYETEVRFPHWICKAHRSGHVIDIIFGSGNGICLVDQKWFESAPDAVVLGEKVRLVPAEEMIWSKAFIMERDRYDGADVAHLLHACSQRLDWPRLLWRFNPHWRVLFSHLILFGFIYPGRRLQIPLWLMGELMRRLELEKTTLPSDRDLCQGTLLSWAEYLDHIEHGNYKDARHHPWGSLTLDQTEFVTAQFRKELDLGSGTQHPSGKPVQSRLHAGPELTPRKSAA
jgi:hypothetical protein